MDHEHHLSDEQILLEIEGESRPSSHGKDCWRCRSRRNELERAMAEYASLHEVEVPGRDATRALLRAELRQRPTVRERSGFAWLLVACGSLLLAALLVQFEERDQAATVTVSVPDSTLTPGAAVLVSRVAVCSQAGLNNKSVPVALQRAVFAEYGIKNAEPQAYEVDYLVTPALGGADDIRNLWPHSYAAGVWNARVKDALEDRLREMVCDGSLDLRQAQQEIASDWIAAYKKYFRTDSPLREHSR